MGQFEKLSDRGKKLTDVYASVVVVLCIAAAMAWVFAGK